jgi:HAD superfamily hydrolase (TIGR01509 family)
MQHHRKSVHPLTIFLDDGGVMNDNAVRGPQWERLVGEFLASRLGGDLAAWGRANRIAASEEFARIEAELTTEADYNAFWEELDTVWLTRMCALVGVEPPADPAESLKLGRGTAGYVTRSVRAAYPGAVDAIRVLHRRGYALNTASGEPSAHLEGYLTGMGVLPAFTRLYGPDLVNTAKAGPLYYERVFRHVGVTPADALVVDDSPQALSWARAAGAKTILIRTRGLDDEGASLTLQSLADLPGALGS